MRKGAHRRLKGCLVRHTFPSRLSARMVRSSRLSQSSGAHDRPVLVPDSFTLKETGQESGISWFWKLFARSNKPKTAPVSIPKFPEAPGDVNLAVALQYGTATGIPQLQKFIKDFVDKVYQPAYSDYSILVQTGNTDGCVLLRLVMSSSITHTTSVSWSRVMQTIMNPGEGFLTEEWTYPSAVSASKPFGMHPVPVAMDKDGMSSIDLRKVLSEWDETVRGCRRYAQSHFELT